MTFAVGNNAHVGHVSHQNKGGLTTPTITLSNLAWKIPEGPFALVCDIEGAEAKLFEAEKDILSRLSLLILETHLDIYSDGEANKNEIIERIKEAGLK